MRALATKQPKKKTDPERKGLLARIHIAKKQLGMTDEEYRAAMSPFGVESAGQLTIPQLEDFDRYLQDLGWRPVKKANGKRQQAKVTQLEALRERARAIAGDLENGEARLRGLTLSICGVNDLAWCVDVAKLKRLLTVLEKYRQGQENQLTMGS